MDNLKLGYGGTQSEMERLLEDAQAISGVEYDISSYADIVDAIHVIQTEMGITGTTASEAATTFSGSLASMQAAAKNVLGYLALGEDIQPSLDALSSTVYTFLVDNMIPMVGNVLSGLPQVVLSLGGDLFSAVSTLLPQATSAGVEIINNIASGLASGIPSFLAQALPMLTQFSGSLRESAGKLVDAGLNLIVQLAAGLIASLPTLIENVPVIVTNIAGIINDNAPKLLTTAEDLLVMLGQGLIAAIPTLVANIPQIITAVVAVFEAFNWLNLGKNLMKALKNGITAMKVGLKSAGTDILNAIYNAIKSLPTKLLSLGKSGGSSMASGIKGMLSAVKSAAGNLLTGVVSAVTSMPSKLLSIGENAVTKMKSVFKISEWKNIGQNVINGIISGITGSVDKLYSSIKSALSGLVGKAKSALGIASPSRVFAQQVGAFIPPGISEGLEAAMPDLLSDTQSAMGDLVDAASEPVTVAAAVGTAVTGSSAYTSSAIPSTGYGNSTYGNGVHFEQTNNYYCPVATPSETSRSQREAARKLLRGVK